jgi:hypothetical protein
MMHENSKKALEEEKDKLSKRCKAVVFACDMLGVATDRQIKDYLNLPDMNGVRPRVTELIKLGLLREHDSVKCDVTDKTVRRVALAQPNKEQLELF